MEQIDCSSSGIVIFAGGRPAQSPRIGILLIFDCRWIRQRFGCPLWRRWTRSAMGTIICLLATIVVALAVLLLLLAVLLAAALLLALLLLALFVASLLTLLLALSVALLAPLLE